MENYIINPESMPKSIVSEISRIASDWAEKNEQDIRKGCVRDYCILPASKFKEWLHLKSWRKAKLIKGYFIVDDPRPLEMDDFREEEQDMAVDHGYNLQDPKSAEEFAHHFELWDNLRFIPHYWTQIGDLIVDFTGHRQFVESGMSPDQNPKRYVRREDKSLLKHL